MPLLIGTSGWHYRHWKGGFYPRSLPVSRWLEHYASRFATVEVNNAFYRLPEPSTFERWRQMLPGGFVVSVKASRYLTHVKRLSDPKEPVSRLLERASLLRANTSGESHFVDAVSRLLERASLLGDHLGPFLLQLPPTLRCDPEALDEALGAFPATCRLAVEARHPSWFVAEVAAVLERRGAALCLADGGRVATPAWRTASWGYVRFHGGRASPESCYGRQALRTWAARLAELWSPTEDLYAYFYAYFNNDAHGCALRDARVLAGLAAKAGLQPTRVPAARETRLT